MQRANLRVVTGAMTEKILFEGPAEALHENLAAQAGVYLVSTLAVRALEKEGVRPAATAGYSLEVVSAIEMNGTLVVRYRETAPPRGTMTAQVLTSPYHLVTVPFFPGDVKFEKVG